MVDIASQGFSRAPLLSRQTRQAASPGDVVFLLQTVRRHRRLVAITTLVGLALGLVGQVTLPKRYVATEQMVLDFRRLANVSPQEAVFNSRLSDAALDSQTEILTGDGVLGRAVDALGLAAEPAFIGGDGILSRALIAGRIMADPAVAPADDRRQRAILALRKDLKVERLGLSYAIDVTASAKTAEMAVRLADGVTDAYVADQMEARRSVANSAFDWFESRLRDLQADVTEAEHKALEYRLSHQILLANGKYIDEQQVQDLSTRLVAAQERRFMAEARVARANAIINGGRDIDGVAAGSLGEEARDPVIVALVNNYHDVSRRMQRNLALYGPTHKAVLKDQTEMASLQDNVVSQVKQIAAGAKSDAEIAASEEASVSAKMQKAAEQAAQSQKARVELTLLQGAADSTTALRDSFVLQYSMSTQQQTFPITETRLTSRASLPFQAAWPTPRKTLVGGLALGLLAGFAGAVGSEALSRRLRTRSDLEAVTGRRCLGYLPACADLAALGRGRPLLHGGSAAVAFAADSLRALLLDVERGAGQGGARVLGIVAAGVGDGATTATAAVAAAAVTGGRRVLVVDADLRRASLSARYAPQDVSTPSSAGMEPVPIVGEGRFACLPAGCQAGQAGPDVLDGDSLARRLDRLRTVYDLILVDLPPLSGDSSARAAAEAVDAFLLVARWNGTPKDLVIDGLDSSPEVEAKLLGAVFTRIALDRTDMIDDAALTGASASVQSWGWAPARLAAARRWAASLRHS